MTAVGGATITLEPLRSLGPDALRPFYLPEVSRINLVQIETTHHNTTHEVLITCAIDVFACPDAIPNIGVITGAIFTLHFADGHTATLQLRIPDTLTLTPASHLALVQLWLTRSGFLIPKPIDAPLTYSI